MRRMAIGAVTGMAIWLGSALAAEAQGITPTGPTRVISGSTSSTFLANVSLPTPAGYRVRLWIYNGSTEIHYSETIFANPYITNPSISIVATHSSVSTGNVLTYKSSLKYGATWYPGPDWVVTVTATRPSKTLEKYSGLALQSVDRDRRRE